MSTHKTPPLLPNPQSNFSSRYPQKPLPHIPADIRAQKIAKGLCYNCDENFDKNHKCKFKEPQLFTVEIASYDGEITALDEETLSYKEDSGDVNPGEESEVHISVNALIGN